MRHKIGVMKLASEIPSDRIIQLPVNHLKTGMYFIDLKSDKVQKELKLIKA
jgi:hypothetical protein